MDLDKLMGYHFSVQEGLPFPPSLLNIFKELKSDLDVPVPSHGNLEKWARQGVLLLNATLTVEAHNAGSHQKKGWEEFTDAVVKKTGRSKRAFGILCYGEPMPGKRPELSPIANTLSSTPPHPQSFICSQGFFGLQAFQ